MTARAQVLLSSLTTEKTQRVPEPGRRLAFRVDPTADKGAVRRAIEGQFEVKVARVNTLNMPGKLRRRGAKTYRRAGWKKALVWLRPGHTLDLSQLEEG